MARFWIFLTLSYTYATRRVIKWRYGIEKSFIYYMVWLFLTHVLFFSIDLFLFFFFLLLPNTVFFLFFIWCKKYSRDQKINKKIHSSKLFFFISIDITRSARLSFVPKLCRLWGHRAAHPISAQTVRRFCFWLFCFQHFGRGLFDFFMCRIYDWIVRGSNFWI